MKKYEHPRLVIVRFDLEDIITVSSADIDGGNVEFPGRWMVNDGEGTEFTW